MFDAVTMAANIYKNWTRSSPKYGYSEFGRRIDDQNYVEAMPKYARKMSAKDLNATRLRLLNKQIGRRLTEVRLALGFVTRKDFAVALQLTPAKYRRYERGETPIPSHVLVDLTAYEVSILYLLLASGEPFKPLPK